MVFLNYDVNFIILHVINVYIYYIFFSVNTVYLFIYVSIILLVWFTIFLAYINNDFIAMILLVIELTVFFIILIFCFLQSTWLQKPGYGFNLNLNIFIVLIFLSLYFLNNNYTWLSESSVTPYTAINTRSDLKTFVYSFLFCDIYTLYIVLVFLLVLILIFIMFNKSIKYNLSTVHKYQNIAKQSFRLGGVKKMHFSYFLSDKNLDDVKKKKRRD